jgi:hypothetical protein
MARAVLRNLLAGNDDKIQVNDFSSHDIDYKGLRRMRRYLKSYKNAISSVANTRTLSWLNHLFEYGRKIYMPCYSMCLGATLGSAVLSRLQNKRRFRLKLSDA